ncbi:MAG TPA: hypothetical protein PLU47_16085 [Azonexus sp.]|nr:hypothetical protein [Azonexus sp.]
MPQIELDKSDHDRIIRLHKKNGWYSGNRLESAELPGYLKVPRGKAGPGIPTLEEEITAYHRGYAEGASARQDGKKGPENPYTHDNVLRRMAIEQGIDPSTLNLRG